MIVYLYLHDKAAITYGNSSKSAVLNMNPERSALQNYHDMSHALKFVHLICQYSQLQLSWNIQCKYILFHG